MLIEILDTSFQVKTDEDPEYFETLLEYYTQKINEIRKSSKSYDPVKIAILCGLILTDELFKTRNAGGVNPDSPDNDEEFDKIIMQMIDKIDKTLYDN